VAKVIERVEAHYEVRDVEMGKVYRWRPESVVLECGCGGRLHLNGSVTSCEECGTDHALAVREALSELRQSDRTIHPWRYSEDREDAGMPFCDAAPILFGLEGGFMKSEDVQLGMLVQVRRGSREADLRDRIGIVR
jgi:hypothetical protein